MVHSARWNDVGLSMCFFFCLSTIPYVPVVYSVVARQTPYLSMCRSTDVRYDYVLHASKRTKRTKRELNAGQMVAGVS